MTRASASRARATRPWATLQRHRDAWRRAEYDDGRYSTACGGARWPAAVPRNVPRSRNVCGRHGSRLLLWRSPWRRRGNGHQAVGAADVLTSRGADEL